MNDTTTDTANKVAQRISGPLEGFSGVAYEYRLNPPVEVYDWIDDDEPAKEYGRVIASAVVVLGEPETLVFPAKESGGEIADWGEIGGGRGYLDPDRAIEEMGYRVASGETRGEG